MKYIDFVSFGEPKFVDFQAETQAEAAFDSTRMVFASEPNCPIDFGVWCSYFNFESKLVCAPSRNPFKKGQIVSLDFEENFFCEIGLTTYLEELGDWIPLEMFSIGSPILSPNSL